MRRHRAISLMGFNFLIYIVAIPAFAHHGNAAINTSKTVTVTGTVTEWVWSNPHCFLKVDVKNDKGSVAHWIMEENNPSTLVGFGFTKWTFKPGDQVTVMMHVAKNGNLVGRPTKILLDGKTYSVDEGGGQDR